MPAWLQDLVVYAVLAATVVALVRHFGRRRARACPACAPRRAAPRTGVRPHGLTILP